MPIAGREPGEELLGALAEAIERAERGADRRRPPPRSRASPRAVAALAERRPASRSSPSRPRSCASAPTTGALVVAAYDLIARDAPDGARSRPRPPLRRHADEQAAARLDRRRRGADQIVIDPPGRWNEPTRARRRVRPRRRRRRSRSRWPSGAERAGRRGWRERLGRGRGRAPRRRSTRCSARPTALNEPAIHRALGAAFARRRAASCSPRACRSATPRRSCRGGDARRALLLQPRRERDRRAGLDRLPASRSAAGGADLGRARRPRRSRTTSAASRRSPRSSGPLRLVVDRQRRRRDLRLPAAGRAGRGRPLRAPLHDARAALDFERVADALRPALRRRSTRARRPRRRSPTRDRVLAHVRVERERQRRASTAGSPTAVAATRAAPERRLSRRAAAAAPRA